MVVRRQENLPTVTGLGAAPGEPVKAVEGLSREIQEAIGQATAVANDGVVRISK
ncbi:MAG: hypothetical protein IIC71_02495 [Acidobacteria bacterium]|nr:hypothetical protein [Acidobacteriota bacterium]